MDGTTARYRAALAFAIVSAVSFAAPLAAENYPASNAIRFVIPTAAGSPPDVIGRMIANEISERENWKIVVENRPGALQTLAIADVLRQPADALSVFAIGSGAMAVPALLPEKNLRLESDLAPVIKTAAGYLVLVVHPSVPANSVAELVALLKAQPGKFNASTSALGTPGHLATEFFRLQTGAQTTIVPYPQGQQRIADLLSGVTQFSFYNTTAVVDLIAAGKLRALAVTAPSRIGALKDVPTVVEQGYPALIAEDWQGLAVKAGAPPEAIARLNAAGNVALETPKVKGGLRALGYEPVGGTPAALGKLVGDEVSHWGKVVREAGIKINP